MQKDYGLNREEAEMLFRQTWLQTFSVCVLVAGKVCHFSMEEISEILSVGFKGTLFLIKSGTFFTVPVSEEGSSKEQSSGLQGNKGENKEVGV